jgi:hypothetical protein
MSLALSSKAAEAGRQSGPTPPTAPSTRPSTVSVACSLVTPKSPSAINSTRADPFGGTVAGSSWRVSAPWTEKDRVDSSVTGSPTTETSGAPVIWMNRGCATDGRSGSLESTSMLLSRLRLPKPAASIWTETAALSPVRSLPAVGATVTTPAVRIPPGPETTGSAIDQSSVPRPALVIIKGRTADCPVNSCRSNEAGAEAKAGAGSVVPETTLPSEPRLSHSSIARAAK